MKRHSCRLLSYDGSIRHLQGCELGGAAAIVPMEAKRDNLAWKRHLNLVTSIERQVVNKRMKQTSIPNVPSYHDQIICGQAHWFIYSSACVSLKVFCDNYFKSMLHAMIPPSATVPKTLDLTIPRLKLMINAEWLAFIWILRHELQKKFQDGLGNTFCQFIHDGCTLESQSKYQAFGLQYTDSNFASNNVVALTFRRARSSAGESVANLAREEVFNTTGYRFDQIIGCSVQDAAARSVAAHLQLEEETCDMHDGDKIGRSAIGELLRTRNKVAINSFPASMFIVLTYLYFILSLTNTSTLLHTGRALMQKLRNQAKHFHSSHSNRVKYENFLQLHPNLPSSTILHDLNETRIISRHLLVRSSLRLKQALIMYFGHHQSPLSPERTFNPPPRDTEATGAPCRMQ